MDEALSQFYQQFNDRPTIQAKILAVQDCLARIATGQLPQTALLSLPIKPATILADPRLMALDDYFSQLRQILINEYGIWFLPNQEWLKDLASFINHRTCLEIMAGNGLISYGLRQLGLTVTATDNLDWQGQDNQSPQPWTTIENLDAVAAIECHPSDVIILSWAPDTSESDWQVLRTLRRQQFTGDFMIIGAPDGTTNSKHFWQEAHLTRLSTLNQHYHSFDTIDDQIFLAK